MDRYGVPIAFLLNGVSFMAVIVALVQVRAEGLPQARRDSSVLQDVVTGVRYAMGTPELRFILSLMLSVSLFVMNHVGSISELYGVSAAYGLGGGLALLCIGSLTLWWRRGRIRGSAVAV